MFCPKCGTKTSDDAKFCPSCGSPMRSAATPPSVDEAKPVQVTTASEPVASQAQTSAAQSHPNVAQASAEASSNTGGSGFSSALLSSPFASLLGSSGNASGAGATTSASYAKHRLIVCVLAALTLVLSFMSWFKVDANTVQASGYAAQGANYLSQLAGENNDYSSSLSYDENYNVWNLGDAGKIASNYQSMYDSATSSYSYSSNNIDETSAVVTGAWAIGMCAMMLGAVLLFSKGRNAVLYVGCVFMLLSWVSFEGLYAGTMHNIGSPTASPVLMAICAAATFVLSFMMKNPEDATA